MRVEGCAGKVEWELGGPWEARVRGMGQATAGRKGPLEVPGGDGKGLRRRTDLWS